MKTFKFLSLFVLAAVLLAACAPASQGFVALPDGVRLGITAVVVWVVSFFLAKLIALVPFLSFLEEFREPLALAIAAALIGWIENIVPDAYGAIAVIAIQLILAILAFFGVGNVLKKRGVKGFK
jgi:hypothetical protein